MPAPPDPERQESTARVHPGSGFSSKAGGDQAKGIAKTTERDTIDELPVTLERKEAELVGIAEARSNRHREERRSDDEIQHASERYLAIRDVDRDSIVLREVRPRCLGFTTAASESALTANGRSAQNAFWPYHGRRDEFCVRTLQIRMRVRVIIRPILRHQQKEKGGEL
jgi:hypothetical protein